MDKNICASNYTVDQLRIARAAAQLLNINPELLNQLCVFEKQEEALHTPPPLPHSPATDV